MKKITCICIFSLFILLLNGCGKSQSETPPATSAETVLSLRIADGAQTGTLLLAGKSSDALYLLPTEGISIFLDGKEAGAAALEDGMMADITFSGEIAETYPAKLCGVSKISVYSRGSQQNPMGDTYDLCGLYLQVLEDLWEKDDGLNNDISYISVDLSDAPGNLSAGEKQAIAWTFAQKHNVTPLTLGYEALLAEGYLSPYLPDDSSDFDDTTPYFWEDGLLFSISATEEEGESYSLPTLRFHANKWRTPLGAYFFYDCTAVWSEDGRQASYSIGAEMIS